MGSSPIEEIKSRLDIVDLVQSYIRLQKAGSSFKALCPFHKEKTPSFFVSPTRQSWHCFGCSSSGDHFSFVQKIEGIEFIDALKFLAQRAGVELKYEDRGERNERAKLLDICETAIRFFEKQLEASRTGQEAQKYLLGRGLRNETVREWRLGFAPDARDGLYQFLRSQGYPSEDIEKAGLTMKSMVNDQLSTIDYRDRFRGRIIFPIFDHHGRPAGFTGRIFGRDEQDGDPKYLNTPQTPIFNKGTILYGFDRAKQHIRTSGAAIVVEGQMDILLAHQAGTQNAVATSGTALTETHLTHLKRLIDTVIFAFDMDRAGEEAVRRGFSLALEQGLMVKVVQLPYAKDPAELIVQDSALWHRICEDSLPVVAYLLERAKNTHNPQTPEGKRAISLSVLPILAGMANAIEQAHWAGEVAHALNVPDESIFQELRRIKRKTFSSTIKEISEPGFINENIPKARRERLEETLIFLALTDDDLKPEILELSTKFSDRIVPYVKYIFDGVELDNNAVQLIEALKAAGEMEFAHALSSKEALREACTAVSLELRAVYLKEELEELISRLKDAEASEDQDQADEILHGITKISASLRNLNSETSKY